MRAWLLASALVAGLASATPKSNPPEQVHIALAGDDGTGVSNAMTISWVTQQASGTSAVRYGTDENALLQVAYGRCKSYLITWDHHVTIGPLKTDTRYYYQVGDEDGGWSQVFSFVSAPRDDKPFTVAIVADMGVMNSAETMDTMRKRVNEYDFMWHAGDISYADDWFIRGIVNFFTFGYEKTWNEYMNRMQSILATKPYMVLPGNHEDSCHDFSCITSLHRYYATLRNFTAFNARFRMPAEESGGTKNMWYSFNYGPVHFVSIDTETDFPNAAEGRESIWGDGGFGDQLSWLRRDLARANTPEQRARRPWIVVAGHRPIYTQGASGADGAPQRYAKDLADAVEDMFMQNKVDIYFAGHVHAYERQYPTYRNKFVKTYNNPGIPAHVVVGCAGNEEGHDRELEGSKPWNAYKNGAEYGWGKLVVYNSTAVEWQFITADRNEVADSFVLTKPAVTKPAAATSRRNKATPTPREVASRLSAAQAAEVASEVL